MVKDAIRKGNVGVDSSATGNQKGHTPILFIYHISEGPLPSNWFLLLTTGARVLITHPILLKATQPLLN
jgi:hypothetical protein